MMKMPDTHLIHNSLTAKIVAIPINLIGQKMGSYSVVVKIRAGWEDYLQKVLASSARR